MRLTLWPQSLFGRLLAASVAAVLLAQAVALLMIAREREHFVLQGSVREWTHRIAETTQMLAPLNAAQRADALAQLSASQALQPPHMVHAHPGMHAAPAHALGRGFLRLPSLTDFESTLREQLRAALGPDYGIEVGATPEPPPPAIALPSAVLRSARAGAAPRERPTLRCHGTLRRWRRGHLPRAAPAWWCTAAAQPVSQPHAAGAAAGDRAVPRGA
jgi:hypothetical protein